MQNCIGIFEQKLLFKANYVANKIDQLSPTVQTVSLQQEHRLEAKYQKYISEAARLTVKLQSSEDKIQNLKFQAQRATETIVKL